MHAGSVEARCRNCCCHWRATRSVHIAVRSCTCAGCVCILILRRRSSAGNRLPKTCLTSSAPISVAIFRLIRKPVTVQRIRPLTHTGSWIPCSGMGILGKHQRSPSPKTSWVSSWSSCSRNKKGAGCSYQRKKRKMFPVPFYAAIRTVSKTTRGSGVPAAICTVSNTTRGSGVPAAITPHQTSPPPTLTSTDTKLAPPATFT